MPVIEEAKPKWGHWQFPAEEPAVIAMPSERGAAAAAPPAKAKRAKLKSFLDHGPVHVMRRNEADGAAFLNRTKQQGKQRLPK